MRRILFVDHVDRILGGGEINLIEWLEAARARARWELSCACPARGRLGQAVHALGVTTHEHGFAEALNQLRVVGRRFSPWAAWRGWRALAHARVALEKTVRAARPDVVVSCTNKDHFCAGPVCRRLGVPSVWWVNDLLTAEFFSGPSRSAFFWQARRGAAHLVAVSEAGRTALLAGGLPAELVSTIHNGIPWSRYARRERSDWRQRWQLPETARLIGLVGRWTPWKGPELFLRLAQARLAESADEHFVLMGEAFNEDQAFAATLRDFEARAGLAGRVHFLPFQSDMAEALGELSVLVHASLRSEPFGRVIIEAMAVGVPVVAAMAGGVPEIITPDQDGMLAVRGDFHSYLACLRQLARDPATGERLARAGRETVERRFTLSLAMDRWEELLTRLT